MALEAGVLNSHGERAEAHGRAEERGEELPITNIMQTREGRKIVIILGGAEPSKRRCLG